MTMKTLVAAIALSIAASSTARAEESVVSYKSLGLELALDARGQR